MPALAETPPRVPKPSKEARKIRAMFGDIAGRYDFLNRLLSARTDVAWREIAAREALAGLQPADHLLDLACGTGDLAITLARHAPGARVVGADFARPMLDIAQQKAPCTAIPWVEADGLQLPFADDSFDLVTIAFGLRNMESLERGLAEMRRVLRPGGRLAILEFSQPENPLVRAVYQPYFLHVLPRIGALLSRKSAYLYLPFSVLHFPTRRELARTMIRGGFTRVRHCSLSFNIAALHLGEKPRPQESANGHHA